MEYRVLFKDSIYVSDVFETFNEALDHGISFCLDQDIDNFQIDEVESIPVSLARYVNSEFLLEQIAYDADGDGIDLEMLNDLPGAVYDELSEYLGKALEKALKKENVSYPENVYIAGKKYMVKVKNNGSRVSVSEVIQDDE